MDVMLRLQGVEEEGRRGLRGEGLASPVSLLLARALFACLFVCLPVCFVF